ncbi:cellulose-binding beta-glucosidase [Coprinopsis cinerea AmutBmut pab1-1]|nr:cellulose-binding beta-glucosidase [Coprinopsis cinerea AmutBmut pab1-1]
MGKLAPGTQPLHVDCHLPSRSLDGHGFPGKLESRFLVSNSLCNGIKGLTLTRLLDIPLPVIMPQSIDIDATLLKLSTREKIKLLTGKGWWHTEAIPHAGIYSMRFSDGPNGIRGTRFFNGVPSTCFPCSTAIGASFDVGLAYKVGQALGDEARAKSTHLLLAPTINIHRNPLGGRSSEFYAEDPHLNGFIASAYINGVQSKGVACTIKHFVANDQETERLA